MYKFSVSERRDMVAKAAGLGKEHVEALANHGELDETAADRMIENVIGTMSFRRRSDQFSHRWKAVPHPFLLGRVKRCCRCLQHGQTLPLPCGGFRTNNDDPIMIAQIQLLEIDDIESACNAIQDATEDLMAFCNDVPSKMIALGGGCKAIEMRSISTPMGTMLVIHLLVDCRDAMGANAVNTMAERVAPKLKR